MSGHELSEERYQELLVRSVDGCLSPADARELADYLEAHPEAREEQAAHLEIKEMTDAAVGRILADAEIEAVRPMAAARSMLSLGFVLLLLGALVLVAFAAWSFTTDPGVPWAVKVGSALIGAGGLVLFAMVLRSRLRARGLDPYEEIDR